MIIIYFFLTLVLAIIMIIDLTVVKCLQCRKYKFDTGYYSHLYAYEYVCCKYHSKNTTQFFEQYRKLEALANTSIRWWETKCKEVINNDDKHY